MEIRIRKTHLGAIFTNKAHDQHTFHVVIPCLINDVVCVSMPDFLCCLLLEVVKYGIIWCITVFFRNTRHKNAVCIVLKRCLTGNTLLNENILQNKKGRGVYFSEDNAFVMTPQFFFFLISS